MGIIGVVAALTLPNLNSSTGDKEKVAKVKKIYQNLEDALGRAEAIYGPYNNWCSAGPQFCIQKKRDRLLDFFKVSKVCDSALACFKENGYYLGKSGQDQILSFTAYSFILADGTSVGFNGFVLATSKTNRIAVDIDGPNKGTNTWGKDLFIFDINLDNNELLPSGYDISNFSDLKDECFIDGRSCAFWVINNDNMDYLKVGTDGKCPDGKTVLDWTTNKTCK